MVVSVAVLNGAGVDPAGAAVVPAPSWTPKAPATSPPNPYAAAMALDPTTGELVLFGGSNGIGGQFSDTWLWTGDDWVQQFPATSPPARFAASMASDPATGRVVLFGGLGGSSYLSDTWMWTGDDWVQQFPDTSPPARAGASMASDPSGQVMLFGGNGGTTRLSDTWIWTGADWVQQFPDTSPPGRSSASMAFDGTGQLVLFSGIGGDTVAFFLSDMWMWTGDDWVQQSPATSPPARQAAVMALDPTTGQLVLFGGLSSPGNSYSSDTWLWTGDDWVQQFPATSPPARFSASMALDPAIDKLVLVGGHGRDGVLSDTWVWGMAPHRFAVTGPVGPVPKGVAQSFTVEVQDELGAPVADYDGTVHFTSTDGAATLPADTSLTDGTGTISVTFGTTGIQTLTATDTVTSALTGTSSSASVRLPAPQNLTAAAASSSAIDLDWDAVSGATEYQILRATNPAGPFSGSGKVTTDQARVGGLSPNTTYYFTMRARDAAGLSRDSNQASATTTQSKPAAPTNLVATGRSAGRVALTWDAPPGTVTGYRILMSTAPGGPYSLVKTKSTPGYIVSGLTPGNAYYFVVQAKNSAGYSPLSEEATATPVS